MSGWCPAPALPISATRSPASTRTRARSPRWSAARYRSSNPACRTSSPPTSKRGALTTPPILPRPWREPTSSSSPSARRRGAATGTRTSPTSMPRPARSRPQLQGLHGRRDQIDRPGRHRRRNRAHHPRSQSRGRRGRRLEPRSSCARAPRSTTSSGRTAS